LNSSRNKIHYPDYDREITVATYIISQLWEVRQFKYQNNNNSATLNYNQSYKALAI